MQKKLIVLSISFFAFLVYFTETYSSQPPLDVAKHPTEHNILLDLSSKTDTVIYDNLMYSNYDCNLLNPKRVICSQFSLKKEAIASNGASELYKYESSEGRTFKLVKQENGLAHIEFKLETSKTLYRYSFTSIEQIPLFTDEKGVFTTGPVEWDMSSLDYIL